MECSQTKSRTEDARRSGYAKRQAAPRLIAVAVRGALTLLHINVQGQKFPSNHRRSRCISLCTMRCECLGRTNTKPQRTHIQFANTFARRLVPTREAPWQSCRDKHATSRKMVAPRAVEADFLGTERRVPSVKNRPGPCIWRKNLKMLCNAAPPYLLLLQAIRQNAHLEVCSINI